MTVRGVEVKRICAVSWSGSWLAWTHSRSLHVPFPTGRRSSGRD